MYYSIGFPISDKSNERRRAILPQDLSNSGNKKYIYIEFGYGDILGYSDKSYTDVGVNVCSREEVLDKDIICDPKIGDASYLKDLKNKIIFGWIHAVQNKNITDILLKNNITAYAWEDMFCGGRHVFWRNNEIAGEAAIIHAFMIHGLFPHNCEVALIGRGNTARGAAKMLNKLGANLTIYDKYTEQLLREEVSKYDVIVNSVLWDITREDHIIYEEDLSRMKENSLIIDISCDNNGAVETSRPTSFSKPVFTHNKVVHYAIDHTPSIFFKDTSRSLSNSIYNYIDILINGDFNDVLHNAKIIENRKILDNRILFFQNRE